MELDWLIGKISAPDRAAAQAAQKRWDSIAKPLNGLGLLEQAVVRIAGVCGNAQVRLQKRGCVVFCADNGVIAEGVTQTGSNVTAMVTENFTKGRASVNVMGRLANCEVLPVDIGVAKQLDCPGVLAHKIAFGTKNITREPAMTREQALEAIAFGAELAGRYKAEGYDILACGEMGIGNTTTACAVTSVLLGDAPALLAGRGAGLSDAGLARKIDAIERAIAHNTPSPDDPVGVLQKVGGLDLAGMTGLFLGGAAYRIPVVIDGCISAAAAFCAMHICPQARDYWIAAHLSNEPMGKRLLEALALQPLITAGLGLGEGTGAVALLPLLDLALAVYHEMPTFDETHILPYQPLGKEEAVC